MTWFIANIGTLIVAAVLLTVVIGIVRYMRKQKSKGSCCGGCSGCSHAGSCNIPPMEGKS